MVKPHFYNFLWLAIPSLHPRQDVLCTFPLLGQAFAIGSDNALVDGDVNAFDHNVSSVWTALCAWENLALG